MPEEKRIPLNFCKDLSILPLINGGYDYTVLFIRDGSMILEKNGVVSVCNAPCVLCIKSSDRFEVIRSAQPRVFAVNFAPVFLNRNLSTALIESPEYPALRDNYLFSDFSMFDMEKCLPLSPATGERVCRLFRALKIYVGLRSSERWSCNIRDKLLAILTLLTAVYQMQDAANIADADAYVSEVLDYIHANYPQPITVPLLCEVAHRDRTTLSRSFKQRTGMSMIDYLNAWRLKNACNTLAFTERTLAQIAQENGFNSEQYFIRRFTKEMGVTPTQYRRAQVERRKRDFQN